MSKVQMVPKTVYFVTKDAQVASAWDFALGILKTSRFVHVDPDSQKEDAREQLLASFTNGYRDSVFMIYGISRDDIDKCLRWIRSNSTGNHSVIALGYHRIDSTADERDSVFEKQPGYRYIIIPFELPSVIDAIRTQAPIDGNHRLPKEYYESEKRTVIHYFDNLSLPGQHDLTAEEMKIGAQKISQLIDTGVSAGAGGEELDKLKGLLSRVEGADTEDASELREILLIAANDTSRRKL